MAKEAPPEDGEEQQLVANLTKKPVFRSAAQRKSYSSKTGPANSMKSGRMAKPLMNPNALKIGKKRKKSY